MYGGVAVIIFAIGIAIGSFVSKGGSTSPAGSVNTFQAGWDAAKKRLSETGYAFPSMPEVVTVSGIVQDANTGNMTIKIRPLEPLADPALDVRTVTFDAKTKFYLIEQKDPIKYQAEIKAFNLKIQPSPLTPAVIPGDVPQPFTKTVSNAQAIKAGMTATVAAANNIKEQKEFVATEITVQVAAASIIPAAVPAVPIAPVVAPR